MSAAASTADSRRRTKRPAEDPPADERAPKRAKQSEHGAALASAPAEDVWAPQFKRGSIVRISLVNFVTYTSSVLRPGPQLNVIVGPNGSGKSSLVCAMVLGFAGKPGFLGRAKAPADFIKTGAETGSIEIELYEDRPGKRNPVVFREIHRSDGGSTWKINGKTARLKDVEDLVKEYNIQVENLCSFLPQDRVASFASLNAAELLKETELAVGGDELLNEHKRLIELKKEESSAAHKHEERTKVLQDMENQNKNLERDVLRFREREKHLELVKWMKKKRPWLLFEAKREEAVQLRDSSNEAKKQLAAFEATLNPIKVKLDAKKKQLEQTDKELAEKRERLKTLDLQRRSKSDTVDNLAFKIEDLEAKREKLAERAEELKRDFENDQTRLDAAIAKLKDEEEKAVAATTEMVELVKQLKAATELQNRLVGERRDVEEVYHQLRGELGQVENQLKAFTDVQQARQQRLRTGSPEAFKCFQWVREQRKNNAFKARVYGPIMLELNVPNPEYANYLEQSLGKWIRYAFIVTADEDKKMFFEYNKRNQREAVTIIQHTRIQNIKYPIEVKDMGKFGIQCYLDSVFEAPDIVKFELCNQAAVHRMVVGTNATYQKRNEFIDFCRQRAKDEEMSMAVFFTPQGQYSLSQSRYSATSSTSIRQVSKAKLLVGIDASEEEALRNKRQELFEEVKKQEEVQKQFQEREQAQLDEIRKLNSRKNELEKPKKAVQVIKDRVEQMRKSQAARAREMDVSRDEQHITAELAKLVAERLKHNETQQKVTKKLVDESLAQSKLVVLRSVLRGDQARLEEEWSTSNANSQRLREAVRMAEVQFEHCKKELKRLKTQADAECELTDEVLEKFKQFTADLDELDQEIHIVTEKANSIYSTDPSVVTAYDKRKNEIAEMKAKMDTEQKQLEERKEAIETHKAQWLPQVTEMADSINRKFSEFFRKIECVGEVKLVEAENDDFEHFGVQISVSYRKGQPVQPLSAHVQSGGERSVATMLFLISLQTISDSPFRLVDEINQGMDATNEAMIFDQVREQTSEPGTPQYFLITPKLIANLKYTKEVTLHAVHNGPWQMAQEQWDQTDAGNHSDAQSPKKRK